MKKGYWVWQQHLAHYIVHYIAPAIIIYLCLQKLWMASVIPLTVSMFHPADSTWFFYKAASIVNGDWLGKNYDSHTLIKGPVFPLYLSLCAKLGISPRLMSDVLYIGASLVFYRTLTLLKINRVIALLGFALMLFNPITMSQIWVGLTRITLYLPLSLLFLCSVLAIIHCVIQRKKFATALIWFLLCGFSLGLAWHTREESIWMALVLAPVLLLCVLFAIKNKQYSHLIGLLIVCAIPIKITQLIVDKNTAIYGSASTIEIKEANFSRAWNAVLSLDTSHSIYLSPQKRMVEYHFSQHTRQKMLQISDNTRAIILQLLDEDQKFYKHYGGGIIATSGIWEFRSAASKAGFHQDAATAQRFYAELADDIEAFCLQNANDCRPPILSKVHFKPGHWQKLWPTIQHVWFYATQFPEVYALQKTDLQHAKSDHAFKYVLGRFFNSNIVRHEQYEINDSDAMLSTHETAQKKWHKINKNYMKYHKYFHAIFITCLLLLLALLAFSIRSLEAFALVTTLGSAFVLIFAINTLLVLTAYPVIGRPIATISAPSIMLCTLALGFAVESIKNIFIPQTTPSPRSSAYE